VTLREDGVSIRMEDPSKGLQSRVFLSSEVCVVTKPCCRSGCGSRCDTRGSRQHADRAGAREKESGNGMCAVINPAKAPQTTSEQHHVNVISCGCCCCR